MKVLLCAKSYYLADSSGETDIIFNIYSYLKKKKVDVTICGANEEFDYDKFDIVHIFDIKNIFDAYKHFKMAVNGKSKIVLSPMYCDMSQYLSQHGGSDRINSWRSCHVYRDSIIDKCNLIICGSDYEKDLIYRDFSPRGIVETIKYGVEPHDSEVPLYNFKERYNIDNYILCVGRICEMKNQLILARACTELQIPLVLLGKLQDVQYLKKCLKYECARYLGFMNEYDLYNAYSFSRCHVSASYIDATCLSSLKAASYGCNIIVSDSELSREYFSDKVSYCNPYSYESIKKAISDNCVKQRDDNLKAYVSEEYNLKDTMKTIYSAYERVLEADNV